MDKNTITEVLNDLVTINNDRVEGYQRAIDELGDGDGDLKTIFSGFINNSQKYKQELSAMLARHNEGASDGTTTSGKIYRMWMDTKAAFTGNERKTVLESCEFGEDAAQRAYKEALEYEGLPTDVMQLITAQKASLRQDHDKVKAMRDAAKAASN